MEKVVKSAAFTLNKADIQQWLHNVTVFGAPLLLLFLLQIQQGVPLKFALVAVYAALLSAVIDILRKWIVGHPNALEVAATPTVSTSTVPTTLAEVTRTNSDQVLPPVETAGSAGEATPPATQLG